MMGLIGLAVHFFIGKYFYELAILFHKKAWVYILMGIGSFYLLALIIYGFIAGVAYVFYDATIEDVDEFSFGILGQSALPIGVLGAVIVYRFLENKWKKERSTL